MEYTGGLFRIWIALRTVGLTLSPRINVAFDKTSNRIRATINSNPKGFKVNVAIVFHPRWINDNLKQQKHHGTKH